jgi:hypothetical protein
MKIKYSKEQISFKRIKMKKEDHPCYEKQNELEEIFTLRINFHGFQFFRLLEVVKDNFQV